MAHRLNVENEDRMECSGSPSSARSLCVANSPTYSLPEPSMILRDVSTKNTLGAVEGDVPKNTDKCMEVDGPPIHEVGDVELKCPCGERFIKDPTIQCRSCKKFQHSICFGLMEPVGPLKHFCDECATKDPRLTCTDPQFTTMLPEYKKDACLYRNALLLLKKHRAINVDTIVESLHLPRKTAVKILHEMENRNLFHSASINPEDITQPRPVHHTFLNFEVLPEYFSNIDNPKLKDHNEQALDAMEATSPEPQTLNREAILNTRRSLRRKRPEHLPKESHKRKKVA